MLLYSDFSVNMFLGLGCAFDLLRLGCAFDFSKILKVYIFSLQACAVFCKMSSVL